MALAVGAPAPRVLTALLGARRTVLLCHEVRVVSLQRGDARSQLLEFLGIADSWGPGVTIAARLGVGAARSRVSAARSCLRAVPVVAPGWRMAVMIDVSFTGPPAGGVLRMMVAAAAALLAWRVATLSAVPFGCCS
jgi:hypothetical protein